LHVTHRFLRISCTSRHGLGDAPVLQDAPRVVS
jgi:hypothetical protein